MSVKTALILLSVFFAFSACQKSSDRAGDPAPASPSPSDQAETGESIPVTTKTSTSCDSVAVYTKTENEVLTRYEMRGTDISEKTRTTSDKGANSTVENSGKNTRVTFKIAEDGAKTQVKEMRHSYVISSKRQFSEKSPKVFYQRDEMHIKKTADEGFFFETASGGVLTESEYKKIIELEFLDDGKTFKEISRKEDGKEVEPAKQEYSIIEFKDGDYDVTTETLKEPYTEGNTTTEREVITCRTKKLN